MLSAQLHSVIFVIGAGNIGEFNILHCELNSWWIRSVELLQQISGPFYNHPDVALKVDLL